MTISTAETLSLYAIARNNTTLQDSVHACQTVWEIEGAIALLYSPRKCQFARLHCQTDTVQFLDYEDNSVDITNVFEARIFNDHAELRWLNQEKGRGRSVLLSEQEKRLQDYEAIDVLTDLEQLDPRYLLWGEGWTKPEQWSEQWSRLTLARIGSIPVPIANLQQSSTVALKVREYLKADDYGNLSVVEERLVKLEIV
jgi:CRISPR-associated protein (TIGR03984 family)